MRTIPWRTIPCPPCVAALLLLACAGLPARAEGALPTGAPDAVVDLATPAGVALVQGAWRYSEARPVAVPFRAAGPDKKASGPPNTTLEIEPHAGAADYDDSAWTPVDPTGLDERRGSGRLCFAWYRLRLTIPAQVGGFDPTGATAVFEITVDDYAEVWVDGILTRELGQRGGSLVAGFNAPNRLVVGRDVRPGQTIQLAVFAANGPLSDAPANYIWVRGAKLELYREPRAFPARGVATTIERLSPDLDRVLAPDATIEQVAEGFRFTEGPVWLAQPGALLFSDPNANTIYRYEPEGRLSVFRERSGYDGADLALYTQPGSNGLALDPAGRLTLCEHGRRRVTRLEADGSLSVLAERYESKRLNSPNDLVYRSDGVLYFTDPPFGLPAFHDDPRRETPYTGVYRLAGETLSLEHAGLQGPNGLAFSPDERYLYVDNWDVERKVVLRFDVAPDGALSDATVFFDMGGAPGDEALDGLKVDALGNLFVSGPGGVWILSPSGEHLGTLRGPELAANFAFGGADGRTLYLTARTGLYRIRLRSRGATFRSDETETQ